MKMAVVGYVLNKSMMTSSNGNIFRVTGPLCGEFTGPSEFPTQRPVTRSFNVYFDLRLNKRLSKQPWGWWFEAPLWSLWRQCNGCGRFTHYVSLIQIAKFDCRWVRYDWELSTWNGHVIPPNFFLQRTWDIDPQWCIMPFWTSHVKNQMTQSNNRYLILWYFIYCLNCCVPSWVH